MSEQTPIAELMARDPLHLSDQDLDAIIEDLRKSRSRFVLTDDKKVGTPAARKSTAQNKREAAEKLLDVPLDDLFKDL
jgi:CO dehydrogenase/acetyl-CoA synthase alpha subunit